MSDAVILVSPAAVDGTPPVQYQARLLADAGLAVELVTVPLGSAPAVKFHHPGVRITTVTPISPGHSKLMHRVLLLKQMLQFMVAVTRARARHRSVAAEIAYDPNGIFISDYALLRPRRRVAHLHEVLQRIGQSHLETRLRKALQRYDLVAVADPGRAEHLRDQMGWSHLPQVTPNYPMKEADAPGVMTPGPGFEVIYGGSLGPLQMIDLLIRSVPLWPKEAHLTLLGDDTRPWVLELKTLAASLGVSDRVRFLGWFNLDEVIARYRQAHLAISLLSPDLAEMQSNVGASNKRYQFMQAGLPQIGDRIPAFQHLLEDNGIGYCVADYNEQAIADLVDYYCRHPEERAAAGLKAEQLHLDRYNYQAAFEPTFRWIVQGELG